MMQSSMQYGHVSGVQGGQSSATRKKRVLAVGISFLVLVAMVVAVAVGVKNSTNSDDSDADGEDENTDTKNNVQASMKAIQTICQPTDYKKVCVDSISEAAGNTTDLKELVKIGFNVTISKISEAAKNSTVLQKLEKDPRSSKALEDCRELMDYAIDDLRHSFNQLDDIDMNKMDALLAELKIWISASSTYLETCLDGFEKTKGNTGESMKKTLNTSVELTSNALAIVAELSSVLTSVQIPNAKRKLLTTPGDDLRRKREEKGFLPAWVSAGKRRLLQEATPKVNPNVMVAQDGSGKYKTIGEALKDVPPKNAKPFIIYIKEGIYKEQVEVTRAMSNVVMIGDGPTKTTITGSLNFVDGTPTFKTATVAVIGDNFMAKNIGFENSAGAEKHQAVALRVQSDMSVFHNCQIDGYQDSLYTHTHRQFYRDCTVSGTIDFIFGNAAVVFQNCTMVVRKPMDNQQCIVTAQGRKEDREPTGIVLQDCKITADPLYFPVRNKLKSFLGRPWKEFSRTIIMYTEIDDLIQPEGWLPWMGDFGLNTCFYAEINNKGPGADLKGRVKWVGIKSVPPDQAIEFTPSKFLMGDNWITPTAVPYTSGLSVENIKQDEP